VFPLASGIENFPHTCKKITGAKRGEGFIILGEEQMRRKKVLSFLFPGRLRASVVSPYIVWLNKSRTRVGILKSLMSTQPK